jgi:hypothetical protein
MKSTVADLIQHLQTLDPDHSIVASIWSVEDLNMQLAEAISDGEITIDEAVEVSNLLMWERDIAPMISAWFEGMTSEINNEIYLAMLKRYGHA